MKFKYYQEVLPLNANVCIPIGKNREHKAIYFIATKHFVHLLPQIFLDYHKYIDNTNSQNK